MVFPAYAVGTMRWLSNFVSVVTFRPETLALRCVDARVAAVSWRLIVVSQRDPARRRMPRGFHMGVVSHPPPG